MCVTKPDCQNARAVSGRNVHDSVNWYQDRGLIGMNVKQVYIFSEWYDTVIDKAIDVSILSEPMFTTLLENQMCE